MNEARAALAVFVKTPGLSPIKTRLAERLGGRRAAEFYQLSIAAVEATVAAAAASSDVCPYWAVAEEAGLADPRWQQFLRISQGVGSLGERLGRVFGELLLRHHAVVAISGDSPQITPDILQDAFRYLRKNSQQVAHVLGRCHDGGFYLVGTKLPLPPDVWHDVPYSTPDAAGQLAGNLAKHGQIRELPKLTDVDQPDDLAVLQVELEAVANLSSEQRDVLDWVASAVRANAGHIRGR